MVLDQHIMLSYNHLAKAMVFRVRDMLVERGYKVWIDEDQITAGKCKTIDIIILVILWCYVN